MAVVILVETIILLSGCGRLERSHESPEIDGHEVTFRFRSPSARTVQVAGDWNNWGEGDAAQGEVLVGLMERDEKSGVWNLRVHLRPGRYRYLFLINESHCMLDSHNERVVDDGRGGKANLLIMP